MDYLYLKKLSSDEEKIMTILLGDEDANDLLTLELIKHLNDSSNFFFL